MTARPPIQLLLVPYDSGHRGLRMGDGPDHLLRHGAATALRAGGRDVQAEYVETALDFRAEIATHYELCGRLAPRVAAAVSTGRRPVVLSGNCGIALGTLAGLATAGLQDVGVVWLDAHGEFNTPESTTSGFLDGMGLAAITGRCWRALAATVPGHRPTADDRVLLAGVRTLDDAEGAAIAASRVGLVRAESIAEEGLAGALVPALETLSRRVRRVYLHLDLDVLDPLVGQANGYATPPGGLTRGELVDAVRHVTSRFEVAAAGLASYDPRHDAEGGVFSTAVAALGAVVEG